MPTLEDLKERLFLKLDENPLLREFFKDMLEERVTRDDWLENRLVQIILRESTSRLELIEQRLNRIKKHDIPLFCQMSRTLKGNRGGFDDQLDDLLAELNGIVWIIDQNYTEIEKLSEGNEKTPDFRARTDREAVLFEVKNLQSPSQLYHMLFLKMEANELLDPNTFKFNFTFDLKVNEVPFESTDNEDIDNISLFVSKIEKAIENSLSNAEHVYKKQTPKREIVRHLSCKWKPSDRFTCMAHQDNFSMHSGYPTYTGLLYPLVSKTWITINRATDQLFTFDKSDSCDKWVLLNWQSPEKFKFDDKLRQKYHDSISKFNDLLELLNPKLHLHLL